MPIFNLSETPTEIKANNVILLEDACTFYVRADGRDTNSGQSPTRAWRTLNHAYRFIKNNVVANGYKIDLDIEGGSYPLDELVKTVVLSSPAHIDDDHIIIPTREHFDKEELKKKVNEAFLTLEDKLVVLEQLFNTQREEAINNFVSKQDVVREIQTKISQFRNDVTAITNKNADDFSNLTERQDNLSDKIEDIIDTCDSLDSLVTAACNRVDVLSDNTSSYSRLQSQTTQNVQSLDQQLKEIREQVSDLQLLGSELTKKYEKTSKILCDSTTITNEIHLEMLSNAATLKNHIDNYHTQYNELAQSIRSHEDEQNPHNITTSDLKFDGTTVEHTLIDLYDRTRVRYQFSEKALTVTNLTNDDLNKQLYVWSANCDFSNEELLIDLEGKLYEFVYLINIPTAKRVKFVNGMICGLYAENIFVPHEFENITFLTQSHESLSRDNYAIAIKNNSNITLTDCKIRAGEKGCIHISFGSFLQIRSSIELIDRNNSIIVLSESGATVDASGVNIIPDSGESHIGHLGWAESNSTQDWRGCSFEGDVFIRYPKTERTGGIVLTNLKDDTYTKEA